MKSIYKKVILFVCVFSCILVSAFTVSADNGGTIVYVTDSGSKYHSAGCGYLSRSQNLISLKDAVDGGYSPCSRCNPPVYDGGTVSEMPPVENNGSSYTVEDIERIINDENSESDLHWAPGATREVWISDQTIHLPDCPKVDDVYIPMELGDVTKKYPPCDYCKPLKYESINDRMDSEDDVIGNHLEGEKNKRDVVIIGAVIITFGVVAYAGFQILKGNKEKHKSTSKQIKQIAEPQIPDGFDIVDGLPATVGHHHRYGLYSVYVTSSGSHYHRRKKCAGNSAHLTNLYLVYQKRKPCTNCCKNYKPNMDFTWYEQYMNFQKEKN